MAPRVTGSRPPGGFRRRTTLRVWCPTCDFCGARLLACDYGLRNNPDPSGPMDPLGTPFEPDAYKRGAAERWSAGPLQDLVTSPGEAGLRTSTEPGGIHLSNRFWQKPRRITAGLVAVAVASLAAAAFTAGPAGALITTYLPNGDGDIMNRYWGMDRYETSVQIALQAAPTCGSAVVTTGANFPDALAGSSLADEFGPIVLV